MNVSADYFKTFKYDHLIRDEQGVPVGRVVMRNDSLYEAGEDIQIALLTIPVQFKESILGSFVYADGFRYKIPQTLPNFRVNKRGLNWVASSFVLMRG